MPDNTVNPVLGIDLGTTYSSIARWTGTRVDVINNAQGHLATPSAVYHNPKTNEIAVGHNAWTRLHAQPENVSFGFKREMDFTSPPGRGFSQREPGGPKEIYLAGHAYTPIDLSAQVLSRLYEDARALAPEFAARGVVVTVPYHFKAHQCHNTELAALQAKLNLKGMIQEPIAASLQYVWSKMTENPEEDCDETILVFDLGGGTFDLTLFRMEKRRKDVNVQVIATGGQDMLGGLDFDRALLDLLYRKAGVDPKTDWEALRPATALKMHTDNMLSAITLKEELATMNSSVTVMATGPGVSEEVEISRREFETEIATYVGKIEEITSNLWSDAGMAPSIVDRVLPVGGSSILPCIRQIMRSGIDPGKVWGTVDPRTSIAQGAALYALYLDDRSALGFNLHLGTVTAHPLGIEMAGGKFDVVIPARTPTPITRSREYVTTADHMTEVEVRVYQGTNPRARENTMVGTVHFSGLVPRPTGQTHVKVSFHVSEQQKLMVTVQAEGRTVKEALTFS